MPPHATSACYCHVIQAGHTNLARLISTGDTYAASHELDHIRAVAGILNDFLLYAPNDGRWSNVEHDRYWDSVRTAYMRSAAPENILTYYIAWEFLAIQTRFDFRVDLVEEGRRLRMRISP